MTAEEMESLFEQAFISITLGDSGKHLLEADAVAGCVVRGEEAAITLNLPPDPGMRQQVIAQVEQAVLKIPGIRRAVVGLTDGGGPAPAPEGSQPRPSGQAQRMVYLDNYKTIIAVASGKGGVGKSTVAVNLAVALAAQGHKVGLFDTDIYGPSVPIMTGLREARPQVEGNQIIPLQKFGVDILSLGNLVDESAAAIWRGPMVHQVLEQLLRDTRWPGGDYMILDLPPGTGDVQITLAQLCEVTGAVIVSTPQDVALLDAIRAVAMFEKVEIPVIGLVENMSAFHCPHCNKETPIFDTGTIEKAAHQRNVAFLGHIPIELDIRLGGDKGQPVALRPASPAGKAFHAVANALMAQIQEG
ncbi:MAG: Mrp/NBP35 family ATP-binding protein [Deltaproteobacteria bacterium]|nr:Mrp/NBP35 family ATP-binding protein [Deltaproteobacteria bacterium]